MLSQLLYFACDCPMVLHMMLTALVSLQMIAASRNRRVMLLMHGLGVFAPLGLVYGLLLVLSWSPDTLSMMMPGSLETAFSQGTQPCTMQLYHHAYRLVDCGA